MDRRDKNSQYFADLLVAETGRLRCAGKFQVNDDETVLLDEGKKKGGFCETSRTRYIISSKSLELSSAIRS